MATEDHHKDSCDYGVEVAKQFITLASAGCAFVIGLSLGPTALVTTWNYISFVTFAASVLCGLAFLMSVVGKINQKQDYNVYSGRHRALSGSQIVLFLVGIVLVGRVVHEQVGTRGGEASSDAVTVVHGNKKVSVPLPSGYSVQVISGGPEQLDVKVVPSAP